MKLFLAFMISFIFTTAPAFANELLKTDVNGKNGLFKLVVKSAPSKLSSGGAGYCGAGEEITLELYKAASPNPTFSKLIESCLETIELKDGKFGSETEADIKRAVKIKNDKIILNWLIYQDKNNAKGVIDLGADQPVFSINE